MPPVITPFPSALLVTVTSVSLPVMLITGEPSFSASSVKPAKSNVRDVSIVIFSFTLRNSVIVFPIAGSVLIAVIASAKDVNCVSPMVAAYSTSLGFPPSLPPSPSVGAGLLSLSLPLPPSPLIGAGLLSLSLVSPPPTVGVKVSSLPFCSSPEGVGVPSVPEGGAVSLFCPPSSVCLLVLLFRC